MRLRSASKWEALRAALQDDLEQALGEERRLAAQLGLLQQAAGINEGAQGRAAQAGSMSNEELALLGARAHSWFRGAHADEVCTLCCAPFMIVVY